MLTMAQRSCCASHRCMLQSHVHYSRALQIRQCQPLHCSQRSGSTNTICKAFTLPTATPLSWQLQHTMMAFHRIESQHWNQRCAHRLSFPHTPACTKHTQLARKFSGRFTIPLLATRQTRASFPASLSPPTLSLNAHLTAQGAIHQTQNPLLWSPPCRRCLSNSPDLLATSIPLLQLLCCDQTALCPYVGHDPNPTLDAPREGLRQGEVLGGGGERHLALKPNVVPPPNGATQPRNQTQEAAYTPKIKEITIHIRQSLYTRYIAGGGPIKTTLREAPIYHHIV